MVTNMKAGIFLLKKFKKKSLKAKIAIIAFIVVILALISYVLYSNFKPAPPAEYELSKAAYGTVVDTLDVSGTVESEISEVFNAVKGVTVQEVLVGVGDRVQKGDKLATFDVGGAVQYLNAAKNDYNKAQKDYNDAKSSTDSTAARKNQLQKDISKKEAEIAAKNNEIAALQKKVEQTQPVTEYVPIPQEQINVIAAQMAQNGATSEQIEQFMAAASQTRVPVTSADTASAEELMQKNLELAQLNSELTALRAENAVTISADNETMLKALKTVADTKKAEYESLKKVFDSMKNGWYANGDGIVTAVNITAGSEFVPVQEASSSQFDISALLGGQGLDGDTAALITSLLGGGSKTDMGTGIMIESYDDMIVTVTVGKADLLKIKTGMKAIVTSVGKTYEGEVVYVGAKAAESSGLNLGSITSSIMGGSGTNGAVVKVKINNPDEKVVIGFDVDIKIVLSTLENVLKVPVEAVINDKGEYFVFIYDAEKGTVSRRKVTRGVLDDTSYQILDGLSEGETVVKTPDLKFTDGTKIKEKTA